MLLNSNFNKGDLETEKESLQADIVNQSSNPRRFVLENVHVTSFRDHMMGQPIYGNVRSVSNITSEDVKQWVEEEYTGDRMVVVASGDVDHNDVVEMAERAFGGVASQGRTV